MKRDLLLPPYDTSTITEELRDEEIGGVPGALETGVEQVDPRAHGLQLGQLAASNHDELAAGLLRALERVPLLLRGVHEGRRSGDFR